MTNITVTRASLSDAIHSKVGISKQEASDCVENILEKVSKSLEKGDSVKLAGFGTFSVRGKKERIGRNPKTKTEVPITARNVLGFKASRLMKEEVEKGLK
ncbi:MAG: integration host factor subunit alpha [Alphaproteobacteria bacterium]